ncbi:MAG: DNA cytosine methyltransferase [Microthrixaceae bacterium]
MSGRTYGVRTARSDVLELGRHPNAPVGESWKSWVSEIEGPVAVDLFCGAGGLSLGMEAAGCTVALAVDTDERALETQRANFVGRALAFDMGDPDRVEDLVGLLSVVEVDVLAGGPPCQPFSRAGRSKIRSLVVDGVRPAEDTRRDLWRAFARVAVEVRPRAVIMENVPDMALGDDGLVIRTMTAMLEDVGYEVDCRLLDAWRFGVPQHRQRLILVALRDGSGFEWPRETKPVTVGDAIGDLPALGHGTGGREMPYSHPQTPFQRRSRVGMTGDRRGLVWDHMTRPVRDDDREAFELMDTETTYSDLPERLRRYRSDIFNDKYHRLGWDELSRSITAHIAKDGYWYIHPGEARTLTVREAARIQTFPDRFRFSGSRSHAFAQIGNAVPPELARRVTAAVLDALQRPGDEGAGSVTPPSTRRRVFRRQLSEWLDHDQGLWLQIGEPWSVLVSTICGRRGAGDELAGLILDECPAPRALPETAKRRLGRSRDERDRLRIASVSAAGRAVAAHGWHSDHWGSDSGIGPAAVRWVRAIGLGEGDVIDTTGVIRVASRFEHGNEHCSGANARVLIAQLIGTGDESAVATAAMAALAERACRPDPDCDQCPLAGECRFNKP